MAARGLITIPARRGKAAFVRKGKRIEVINTYGTQVVDCWAFSAVNPGEFMSMEHSRVALGKVRPEVGDSMVTNQRHPILTILSDTSPGFDTVGC